MSAAVVDTRTPTVPVRDYAVRPDAYIDCGRSAAGAAQAGAAREDVAACVGLMLQQVRGCGSKSYRLPVRRNGWPGRRQRWRSRRAVCAAEALIRLRTVKTVVEKFGKTMRESRVHGEN